MPAQNHTMSTQTSKKLKKTQTKTTKKKSEDANRKAEAEIRARKQVACLERAFRIVEKLAEETIEADKLKDAGQYIDAEHYVDIVEERSISGICGYPICSNTLANVPQQKYHISLRSKKVYDITERKKFCSNQCYKASKFYQQQIPSSPLWVRDKERPVCIRLLAEDDNRGSAGEVVVGGQQDIEQEIQHLHKLDKLSKLSTTGTVVKGNNVKNTNGQVVNGVGENDLSQNAVDNTISNLTKDISKCHISAEGLLREQNTDGHKTEETGSRTVHYVVPDAVRSAGLLFSSFTCLSVCGEDTPSDTAPRENSAHTQSAGDPSCVNKSILKQPSKPNMRKKSVHFSTSSISSKDDDVFVERRPSLDSISDSSVISEGESNRLLQQYRVNASAPCYPGVLRRKSVQFTMALEERISQRKLSLISPDLPKIKVYGMETVNAARNAAAAKGGTRVVFRGSFGRALRRKSIGVGDVNVFDALRTERRTLDGVVEQKGDVIAALHRRFQGRGSIALGALTSVAQQADSLSDAGSEISPEESTALLNAYRNGIRNDTSQQPEKSPTRLLSESLEDKIEEGKKSLSPPALPHIQNRGGSTVTTAEQAAYIKDSIQTKMRESRLQAKRNSLEPGEQKVIEMLYKEQKTVDEVKHLKDELKQRINDAQDENLEKVDNSEHSGVSKVSEDSDAKMQKLEKLLDKRESLQQKLAGRTSPTGSNCSVSETNVRVDSPRVFTFDFPDQNTQAQLDSRQTEEKEEISTSVCDLNNQSLAPPELGSVHDRSADSLPSVEGSTGTSNSADSGYQDHAGQSGTHGNRVEHGKSDKAVEVNLGDVGVKVKRSAVMESIKRAKELSKTKDTKNGKNDKGTGKPKKTKPKLTTIAMLQKVMAEWKTEATVTFLNPGSSLSNDIDKAEFQTKYKDLCQRLAVREKEYGDVIGGHALDGEPTASKEVPGMRQLQEEQPQFELKVREFYGGCPTTAEASQKTEPVEEPERAPVLPYVDSQAQMSIRRKIVLDRLNRVLGDLLGPLNLPLRTVSSDVRQLVNTFNLTNQNVIFKPAEWTLVGYMILKMLCLRLPDLRSAFSRDYATHFYRSMILSVGGTDSEINNFVTFMASPVG